MRTNPLSLALVCAVLFTGVLPSQRTRTLVSSTNAGAVPVTAHRQVAWSSFGLVYLWNGTTLTTIPTGGQSVEAVGFVGPGRLFMQVQGGPSYGYNVWDAATGTLTRLLANAADTFYADGSAAVFPLPGYAGFGLYTGGTSYTSFPAAAASTYEPQVNGPYVTYQRRTGVGYTDWQIYRYNRVLGTTIPIASSSAGGTLPRVDEAGRVLWISGNATSITRLWWNDLQALPRILVDNLFGAMPFGYDAHAGQIAYARRPWVNAPSHDLILEEGSLVRTIEGAVMGGITAVRARDGMAVWAENTLRHFDGLATLTLNPSANLPRAGEMMDRGWVVHGGNGGPVVLREAPLTWDSNTISASAGGSVRLNLNAGAANGGRRYLVLASLSGSYPGIPFAGRSVPLTYDSFVLASASLANSSVFVNTAGALDAAGSAVATFVLPPGVLTALINRCSSGNCPTYLTFAYFLYTPSFDYVSNPARVKIAP